MVRKWQLAVLALPVMMLSGACNSYAAPPSGVKIGDAAPDWSGIIGIDDK